MAKQQQTPETLFVAKLTYSEPKKHSWLYRGEGALKSIYVSKEESGFGDTPPPRIQLIALPDND